MTCAWSSSGGRARRSARASIGGSSIVPDLTGTKHLVEAVGYARALEWTASARFVDAQEALASGLVNRVVSRDQVDEAVKEMVDGLTAHPHGAVTATKSLLLGAVERSTTDSPRWLTVGSTAVTFVPLRALA